METRGPLRQLPLQSKCALSTQIHGESGSWSLGQLRERLRTARAYVHVRCLEGLGVMETGESRSSPPAILGRTASGPSWAPASRQVNC